MAPFEFGARELATGLRTALNLRRRLTIAVWARWAVAVATALSSCDHRPANMAAPLPQEIFVWQRVWNEPVESALAKARGSVAGFAVLAAEIDLREREPRIFRPNINYAAVRSTSRPVSLAIRIDPFGGPFN